MIPPESGFVFNIVWTGSVFPYLRYFVGSQLRHSDARFRFVANGCPPDQVRLMEQFAAVHAQQVIEVFVTSESMERHGTALDVVLQARDDGDYFCFVDPDIIAEAPFLGPFAAALDDGCAGVTSGKGIWTDDVTVPRGHPGIPGECFYSADGYLFGSPHFAMYRAAAVRATMARWDVGFGSGGGREIPERTRDALAAAGHEYWLYDTGKMVNILLQEDGNRLCHFEHAALLHIGGLSHYLSPPEKGGEVLAADEEPEQRWPWPAARLEVARYTASLLRALYEGQPAPEAPSGLESDLAGRLERVRRALITLIPPGDLEDREGGQAPLGRGARSDAASGPGHPRDASSTTNATPPQSMDRYR
jgi:hypothetical protein